MTKDAVDPGGNASPAGDPGWWTIPTRGTAGIGFDELVTRALDSDEDIGGPAVAELGRVGALRPGSGREIEQGLRWLTDPTPLTRSRGADLLAAYGEATVDAGRVVPAAVEAALIAAAETETSPEVVGSLVVAFCRCRTERALPWLLSVPATAGRDLVETLAACLPSYGEVPQVVKYLEGLLEHRDDDIRDWASFAFARQLPRATTPTLSERLLDLLSTEPNPVTRFQAILALAVRGDRRVVPILAAALLAPLTADDADLASFGDLTDAAALVPDTVLLPGLRAWAAGISGPGAARPDRYPADQPDPDVVALIDQIAAMT